MSHYAFCEPSWASVRSAEHIRLVVGPSKLGGGVESPALCGFDLARGWDIPGDVTDDRVRRGMTAECNPTCPECARIFLATSHHPRNDETTESEGNR